MKFIVFFFSFYLCLYAQPLHLELHASSAILMNADSKAVLFEKHAHVPRHPASTTKIGTALFILDKGIDLSWMATVSAECLKPRPQKDRDLWPAYWLDPDGTMMGIKRGEMLSMESLLYGLMLSSGNDAANVIAETVGGTIPNFMGMLNEYLQSIGCKNTQFRNPHGLTHPEHVTTAYDLALMTSTALKHPKFRQIISSVTYVTPKSNKQPPQELKQHNALVRPQSKHYYSKALGGKTGFTAAALNTLVAAAEHEGRILIAVILGCEKSVERYEDARKLFETAFAEKKENRRLMGPENIFFKEITGSKVPFKAALSKELAIEYFPSEEPKCKAALHWSPVHLPLYKGQKVGEVHILDEDTGHFLQKGDLVATEDVKGTFFFVLKEKISQLFR